jgi:hypothetical protein
MLDKVANVLVALERLVSDRGCAGDAVRVTARVGVLTAVAVAKSATVVNIFFIITPIVYHNPNKLQVFFAFLMKL